MWSVSWLIVIAAAGGPAANSAPPAPLAPVTVDDVLATEFIGRAEFSPDGHWLAYNLVPPFASLSDFSYWMHAGGLSGHQLWVKDLETGRAPILQPGLDPDATNFLFGISPDSSRVVVVEHREGRLRLVACRLGEDACVRFEPMPDIRDRYAAAIQWNERLNWISADRLAMPVRRPDLPGSEMRSRAATGHFLAEAWRQAWAGDGVTASQVTSTGQDRSADWAEGDLVVFNLSTGRVDVLAPGRFAGVTVSPDQGHLLAARVAERRRPDAEAKPMARETHPIFDRRYALRLIDTRTGHVRDLDVPFEVDPGSFTWRADSAAFAVFGWNRGEPVENGQFYIFDLNAPGPVPAGRDALHLTASLDDPAGRWWPGPARAAFIGDRLAVHGRRGPGEPPGWYLLSPQGEASRLSGRLDTPEAALMGQDPSGLIVAADGSAYRLEPGRRPRRIDLDAAVRRFAYRPEADHASSGESFPMPGFTLSALSGDVILVASDRSGEDTAIEFLTPENGKYRAVRIDVPPSGGRVVAASRSAEAFVMSLKDGAATRLVLVRKNFGPSELARINGHLNRIRHPQTRQMTYSLSAPDGSAAARRVSACLLLPPGFDASRTYPVLMEIYPTGSGGGCRTLAEAPSAGPMVADLWAARGFIYIRPAFPLDLARTPDDPLGRLGVLVDETIDALGAAGFADTDRVVAFGFSQGGMASLVASVQSDRLAAVISMNGWADYFSHYFGARGLMRYFHLDQNGGDNRWRYECEGAGPIHGCPFGFGDSALVDPARYILASPVARAEEIGAPVMLVHSDFDYFDMAQYDEMFGALYRAGKEATYVRYWGEGHGPSSPVNIRDLWIRIDTFLDASGVLPAENDDVR